jgi:hypothetical protein
MSQPDYISQRRLVPHGTVRSDLQPHPQGPANLADILERVLDKGIVIAGDIQVNLLDIELLTIKIRLLIASVDRAKEMGINWWESDPTLTRGADELVRENEQLRARLDRLEEHLALPANGEGSDKPTEVEVEVTETTKKTVEESAPRRSSGGRRRASGGKRS